MFHLKTGLAMMRGSGGDYDYIIIAHDKDLALGVKVGGLDNPGSGPWPLNGLLHMTMNIRSAALPKAQMDAMGISEAHEPLMVHNHNPWNIASYDKVSNDRRSVGKMFTFKKGSPMAIAEAVEYISNGEAAQDLVTALLALSPPEYYCADIALLVKHFQESMDQARLLLIAKMVLENTAEHAVPLKGIMVGNADITYAFYDAFKAVSGEDHPSDPRLAEARHQEKQAVLKAASKESGTAVLIKKAGKGKAAPDPEDENGDENESDDGEDNDPNNF